MGCLVRMSIQDADRLRPLRDVCASRSAVLIRVTAAAVLPLLPLHRHQVLRPHNSPGAHTRPDGAWA